MPRKEPPSRAARLKVVTLTDSIDLRLAIARDLEADGIDAEVRVCAAAAVAPEALHGYDAALLEVDDRWCHVLVLALRSQVPELPLIGLQRAHGPRAPKALHVVVPLPYAPGDLSRAVLMAIVKSGPP